MKAFFVQRKKDINCETDLGLFCPEKIEPDIIIEMLSQNSSAKSLTSETASTIMQST